jgi:ABC-type phosphate transport system auxiliary subunit
MKKFTPEGGENGEEASGTATGDSSPKLSTSPGLGDSSDNLQIASVSLAKQMIDHEINEKVKLIREEFDKKIQEAISAETSKLMARIKVQHEKVEDLLQQQKKDLEELSTEPNSNKASLDKLNTHINMTSQLLENMTSSNDTNNTN